MYSYDFHQLNDKEFENLAIDLLSEKLKIDIDRFKAGIDGGIDGYYYSANNGEIVVQCKHYVDTPISKLLYELENKEALKVKKLSPARYIFVTSKKLSKTDKDKIKKIFHPYILNLNDIVGCENLNKLISDYKSIEKKYYKLWIASTTILETILDNIVNNDILGRSKAEIERMHQKVYKYVPTEKHYEGVEKLEKERVLIITGEPGAGKTTLAENLTLFFSAKGYQFVYIATDITDAERVYKKDVKQIFFYDDFLGANYFEAIYDKKDSHIVKFIERIKADKDKLFVLTSRTNILKRGLEVSQYLENAHIEKNKYQLSVQSLRDKDKAMMLYNHMYHSQLPSGYSNEIRKDKKYRNIIFHKNFNPRLIEFILDSNIIQDEVGNSDDYWTFIHKTLTNPKAVWKHPYEKQLDGFSRNIVNLVVFNGGRIYESQLKVAFDTLNELEGMKSNTHLENDYSSTIKLVLESFIDRTILTPHTVQYSLFNPSIGDFVINRLITDTKKIGDIYIALGTEESLTKLKSLISIDYLTANSVYQIYERIFDNFPKWESKGDYGITLSNGLKGNINKRSTIIKFLRKIIDEPFQTSKLAYLCELFQEFKEEFNENDLISLTYFIDQQDLMLSEIVLLGRLYDTYEISNKELLKLFKGKIQDYLTSYLTDTSSLDYYDFVEEITEFEDKQTTEDYKVDKEGIIDSYMNTLNEAFSDMNSSSTIQDFNIDLLDIAEAHYDESLIIDKYLDERRAEDYDYDDFESGNDFDLDDLFLES